MTQTVRIACLGLGLTAGIPAVAANGQPGTWSHHGMMWGGGSGWFMGPFMMLLFLLVVVAVVVLVVRWLGGSGGLPGTVQGSNARRILEERFARGEIDEEEFRRRKQALEE